MKKTLIIIGIFLVLAFIIMLRIFYFSNPQNNPDNVFINGHKFEVETVATSDKLALGLGKRETLCSSCGMLFKFGGKGVRSFWMKDMRFSLDIFWIADGKIVYIARSVVSDYKGIIIPNTPADEVLEINAGLADKFNIQVGDSIN